MAQLITWSRALVVLLVFGCLISGLYADPTPKKTPPKVVSPDGKFVAEAVGGAISVSDAQTQQVLFRFVGSTASTSALAYSPDGKWLAAGGQDKSINMLDGATGKLVMRLTVANPILGLSFSPEGKTLTSVETDLTTRVWDIATGKLLQVTKKK